MKIHKWWGRWYIVGHTIFHLNSADKQHCLEKWILIYKTEYTLFWKKVDAEKTNESKSKNSIYLDKRITLWYLYIRIRKFNHSLNAFNKSVYEYLFLLVVLKIITEFIFHFWFLLFFKEFIFLCFYLWSLQVSCSFLINVWPL